ncbi:MAG TPA: pentapeptide repeat-containing protein [Methyloceanibacter sp.]|nr:pentapeptide repeat-containing protein [Methyloceanibacter sp.]
MRKASYRSCTDTLADRTQASNTKVETDGALILFNARETDGDFRYARLDQATLAAADLSRSSFDHANLAGADLTEANLSGACLRFATAPVAGLAAADLSRADLQLSRFDQANLAGANLSGAMLDHGDFGGACLAHASLNNASLRFAKLDAADVGGADLSGADLRYAKLKEAGFAKANLSGALLDYADLFGANLAETNLCGAHLRYAKNLTPAQVLQARIDDTTVLPLHYFEPRPPKAKLRAFRWKRPLLAASLFIAALSGSLGAIGLVFPLKSPTGQAILTVSSLPTPALAALGPAVLVPAMLKEAAATAQLPLPIVRASTGSYATLLAHNSSGTASDILPSAAEPIPSRALRTSAVGPVLLLAVSDAVQAEAVGLETIEHDGPSERLALAFPRPGEALADAQLRLVAASPVKIAIRVKEKADAPPASAAPANVDPLTLVVSLGQQRVDIYRGTEVVANAKISSGKPGYDTRTGVFSILEKRRYHHSNLFSGAPMPWMQRMTWTGTALHAGIVPGYPASHGCVRLPFSFAPKLFQMTNVGENVVVAQNRVVPHPIEHSTLFQPALAEPQVSLALASHDTLATDVNAAAALRTPEQADLDVVADNAPGAPLRILITRRTERDRIIAVQYLLASLGYLKPQNFTGRVGAETIGAIKAFQKANGLRGTGAYSSELAKHVYLAAGKSEPPPAHLYVRQDFRSLFDMPVALRHPERPLGTHLFTAMNAPPGKTAMPWIGLSLEGDDPTAVLDRIEIPDEARREISDQLSPGSSLIIAEMSVNSALLREGDDFIVSTKDSPPVAASSSAEPRQAKAKAKKANRAKAYSLGKPKAPAPQRPIKRRAEPPASFGGFWGFRRW